jgi:hypothetical protein
MAVSFHPIITRARGAVAPVYAVPGMLPLPRAPGYDHCRMKVTQTSSRTVRIQTDSGAFGVPYRIFWNGHDRDPESIVLQGDEVQAFFLFATVRDKISEDAGGVRISRTWSVMTPGTLRLSFEADFDASEGWPECLFPGAAAEVEPRAALYSMLGERTSLPSSLFLFTRDAGVLLYSSLPGETGDAASIGVRRVEGEDGPILRVETRIPPVVRPSVPVGPKPGQTRETEEGEIVSEGSLERRRGLTVVFAPRGAIVLRGMRSACRTLPKAGRPSIPSLLSEENWKSAVSSCLETHLYASGATVGLRETAGSRHISASACAAMALLIRRLFPADDDLLETSLRLADFCLRGQHPTGLFYETYGIEEKAWLGVPGRRARNIAGRMFGGKQASGPLIPMEGSARTADLLLRLSETLEEEGRPGRKYALAAERFVDFFFDAKGKLLMPGALHSPGERVPAEEGMAGFELYFPLRRLARIAKRDKYKKALESMKALFLQGGWDAARPPASRAGRDSDSKAALLCGRLAAAMLEDDRARLGGRGRERGRGKAAGSGGAGTVGGSSGGATGMGPEQFLSIIAPWIRINRPPRPESVDSLGGVADSFRRARLLFKSAETACVLMSLGRLSADKETTETASDLARLTLEFGGRAPVGSSYLRHVDWSMDGRPENAAADIVGPVDSRLLTREVESAIALKDTFFARAGKTPGAKGAAKSAGKTPNAGARRAPDAKRRPKTSVKSCARSGSSAPSRKPSRKP